MPASDALEDLVVEQRLAVGRHDGLAARSSSSPRTRFYRARGRTLGRLRASMTTTGRIRAAAGPALAAALAGALLAVVVNRAAPAPIASVARGSEEAFATGLHRREIPPRGRPQRWTTESARFGFRFLLDGPATVEVGVRGQRAPVAVAVDGVVVGMLAPGQPSGAFDAASQAAPCARSSCGTVPFVAGGDGRRLGALLERVAVRQAPPRAASARARAACSRCRRRSRRPPRRRADGGRCPRRSRARHGRARGGRALAGRRRALAATPWRSRACSRRSPSRPALFGGVVGARRGRARAAGRSSRSWPRRARAGRAGATSPVMVVSDAVFHANNLGARRRRRPASSRASPSTRAPFRFPVRRVVLRRCSRRSPAPGSTRSRWCAWGAALAGRRGGGRALRAAARRAGRPPAALAVVLLQLLPGHVRRATRTATCRTPSASR